MRVAWLVAALLFAAAPIAAAAVPYSCVVKQSAASVCAGESNGGASCASGGSELHATFVDADAPGLAQADAGGYAYCAGAAQGSGVELVAGPVILDWFSDGAGCHEVVEGAPDLGCPGGPPPNPGWGHLLA